MKLGPLVTAAALSGWLASITLIAPATADETRPAMTAQTTHAQLSHTECYCRAQGRTFTVGDQACLRTPGGPRIAECGMVLNNTSWRFTERPCPES